MLPGTIASRRRFLEQSSLGFGAVALGCLSQPTASADTERDLLPRLGHFPGRAKSVILLFQNGGPSQMDLFDPKPELQRRSGQLAPDIRGLSLIHI